MHSKHLARFTLLLPLFIFCFSSVSRSQNHWFGKSAPAPLPKALHKSIKKGQTFDLDIQKTKAWYKDNKFEMELSLPFGNEWKNIKLKRNSLRGSNYQVLNSQNKDVRNSLQLPIHYKYMEDGAFVALSLFADGRISVFYSGQEGNLNVAPLPDSLGGSEFSYVLFFEQDLISKKNFTCHSEELATPKKPNQNRSQTPAIQSDTTCRLTEIYWECDYDMYEKGGNSIQGALNSFEAMFNGTAILFEIENINIGISAVKVWDTPEPYNYSSSFTALADFRQAGTAANWPGQLAHLLSTKPLNLGGVAFLNALCTDFRYGFSNIDFTFAPLPIYSWTLSTIAHELGHNFNSPHTHNCFWEVSPGQFGQIDSCWNAEGGCQTTVRGRVGTIMSYCHLTGSVNLSLGFGPLPGNRIRQAYANMPCVSGSIVIPNFTPITSGPYCVGDTVLLSAEELDGYSYRWQGPNGFLSNSRVAELPNATAALEGIYSLRVKKAACESRWKKTDLVFNCMQVAQTPSNLCAGSTISVPFFSTGVFHPGNKFILQLSNTVGSFANPVTIDTLDSSLPFGTILTTLPANLPLGNGYKYRFLSTNPAYVGKANARAFSISPTGASPNPQHGERCGHGSVQLSVAGGSGITWYESPTSPFPLLVNRRFDTPFLTQSRSYFAQSGIVSRFRAGLNLIESNDFATNPNGFTLTSSSTQRLDSVQFRHQAHSGPLCNISLRRDGIILNNLLVSANGPDTKVALFWRIDPGSGYELRVENIQIPLGTNSGITSIPSGSNTLTFGPFTSGPNYPYLFNWVVNRFTSCPSRRVEVFATVKPGTSPADPTILQAGTDSIFCNGVGIKYQWQINGQINATLTQQKIRVFINSSYRCRYLIDSCWSDWSENYIHTSVTSNLAMDTQEGALAIMPNPTKGPFIIKNLPPRSRIILVNLQGKIILDAKATEEFYFDLSTYPKGIYGMRCISENSNHSAILIKD